MPPIAHGLTANTQVGHYLGLANLTTAEEQLPANKKSGRPQKAAPALVPQPKTPSKAERKAQAQQKKQKPPTRRPQKKQASDDSPGEDSDASQQAARTLPHWLTTRTHSSLNSASKSAKGGNEHVS